jgi:hypothetical protein
MPCIVTPSIFSTLHTNPSLNWLQPQIWERMIPAVWRLCLWTLESLTDYESKTSIPPSGVKGCAGAGGRNRVYLTNKEGLSRTVLRLCECLPSMRETVVSNLLGRCYAEGAISSACSSGSGIGNSSAFSDSVAQERDSAWLMNLHPLGYASAEYGIESVDVADVGSLNIISSGLAVCAEPGAGRRRLNAGTKIRISEMRKAQSEALLASTVLESLVGEHPEIGASVLSSIMDRLSPSSPSQGGLLALPPAAILHRYGKCVRVLRVVQTFVRLQSARQ